MLHIELEFKVQIFITVMGAEKAVKESLGLCTTFRTCIPYSFFLWASPEMQKATSLASAPKHSRSCNTYKSAAAKPGEDSAG